MPFSIVGDIKIYYEVQGQGDPLVLIQGYGHHSLHWGVLPGELAKQHRVILVDNRGTGRSSKPDSPVTTAIMADDVCRVLNDLYIERANIFGVSMGGMVAQQFALNHPDRLLNLILGCTSPGGTHSIAPDPGGARILFDLNYLKNLTPEQRSREVFSYFCTPEYIDSNPNAVKYYYQVTIEYPTPNFIFQRQAEAVLQHDTWDRLPGVKSPTMVIHGTSDRLIPCKNGEILAERIPGAELVLLRDKRHGFFIEAMDSTKSFVIEFLRRQAR